jgi:hypothetical protein
MGRDFSLYHRVPIGSEDDPSSSPMDVGVKVTEGDCPPLSVAEVKTVWSYTSTPPYVL